MKSLASFSGVLPIVLAFAPLSFATANEVVATFPAGSAQEVLENPMKGQAPEKDAAGPAGGAIRMKKDCRLPSGKRVTEGQKDYERCLKEKLEKTKK
jgi:hypothetical protein